MQPQVTAPEPSPARPTLALLLPLSGGAEGLAEDMLNAAQMALFDVGENDAVLLPRDTGGTAQGAAAAMERALDEGAQIVLGPLFSGSVQAITPMAQARGVPVLAFSNVREAAAPGVYLLGYRPEEQIERVLGYAVSQGRYRFAGLAPDDPYGQAAIAALRESALVSGAELGPTAYYDVAGGEPTATVQRVASEPFDAILLADGGLRLRALASMLTYYDVDPAQTRYLGTMRWADDVSVFTDPALHGGWYAAPEPANLAEFSRRFEAAYGRRPQQELLTSLAYDATALAVALTRAAEWPRLAPETLADPQGFFGATGVFRLRPDGLAEHGLAVLEVAPEGVRVVDPAPRSFVEGFAAR